MSLVSARSERRHFHISQKHESRFVLLRTGKEENVVPIVMRAVLLGRWNPWCVVCGFKVCGFTKKRRDGKKGLRLRWVFDTILSLSYGAVAQLVEHHVRNVGVESSNLFFSTIS